jgi:hypothetical protein
MVHVVGFTTRWIRFPPLVRCDSMLCDKVYQWFAAGQLLCPGTLCSPSIKLTATKLKSENKSIFIDDDRRQCWRYMKTACQEKNIMGITAFDGGHITPRDFPSTANTTCLTRTLYIFLLPATTVRWHCKEIASGNTGYEDKTCKITESWTIPVARKHCMRQSITECCTLLLITACDMLTTCQLPTILSLSLIAP